MRKENRVILVEIFGLDGYDLEILVADMIAEDKNEAWRAFGIWNYVE